MNRALILLFVLGSFAVEVFADDRQIRSEPILAAQAPVQDPPPSGQPAASASPARREPRVITTGTTMGFIPKFGDSSGTLTESLLFESENVVRVSGILHVTGSQPLLQLAYAATAGAGSDVTGLMGSAQMLSFGFNSEARFSGTQATASGRTLYFFDRVSSLYRGAVDGEGTWWFGTAATNYGLKVLAPAGSTVGMTIDSAGKVGIGGAPAATAKLHVVGDISATGNITGQKVIGAVYQDLAEWVPASTDMEPGTVVVLNRAKSNEVMASSRQYDTAVAGVVSANPGIILGVGADSKEQIATTGRVKVRVDARSRAVRVGDLLVTSDVPGTAMRSEPMDVNGRQFHQPGTIIGKALEPLEGSIGEILVLLSMQ